MDSEQGLGYIREWVQENAGDAITGDDSEVRIAY